MFDDMFLNSYTTDQIKMPTLPSNITMNQKRSRIIFNCQMIKGEVILTKNFKPYPAGSQSWSRHQESGSTSSPSTPSGSRTQTERDPTFQVLVLVGTLSYWYV